MNTTRTEQQPVAWIDDPHKPQPHCVTDLRHCCFADYKAGKHLLYTPLYAAHSTAQPPQAEPDDDLDKLIERLEKRYGISMLGNEKRLHHFARDWLFLTTPEAQPSQVDTLRQPQPQRERLTDEQIEVYAKRHFLESGHWVLEDVRQYTRAIERLVLAAVNDAMAKEQK